MTGKEGRRYLTGQKVQYGVLTGWKFSKHGGKEFQHDRMKLELIGVVGVGQEKIAKGLEGVSISKMVQKVWKARIVATAGRAKDDRSLVIEDHEVFVATVISPVVKSTDPTEERFDAYR